MSTVRTLRLHVLSDLHLTVAGMAPPVVDADLTLLAGDIARPERALAWAESLGRPVLYVAGNHEFYGGNMAEVRHALRTQAPAHNVTFLDQDQAVIGGVRFLGTTLWTDFGLFGASRRAAAMAAAGELMRDYAVIRNADGTPYQPRDARARFDEQLAWLKRCLATPFAGPTVVITHHAPAPGSVHPRFADNLVSAAFVSDLSPLMGQAVLWVHGHTHDSFDYRVRGTRVLCNPRGYQKHGQIENPAFDPALCVDLPVAG